MTITGLIITLVTSQWIVLFHSFVFPDGLLFFPCDPAAKDCLSYVANIVLSSFNCANRGVEHAKLELYKPSYLLRDYAKFIVCAVGYLSAVVSFWDFSIDIRYLPMQGNSVSSPSYILFASEISSSGKSPCFTHCNSPPPMPPSPPKKTTKHTHTHLISKSQINPRLELSLG